MASPGRKAPRDPRLAAPIIRDHPAEGSILLTASGTASCVVRSASAPPRTSGSFLQTQQTGLVQGVDRLLRQGRQPPSPPGRAPPVCRARLPPLASVLHAFRCGRFAAVGSLRSVRCGRFAAVGSLRSVRCGRFAAVGSLRSVRCGRFAAVGSLRSEGNGFMSFTRPRSLEAVAFSGGGSLRRNL